MPYYRIVSPGGRSISRMTRRFVASPCTLQQLRDTLPNVIVLRAIITGPSSIRSVTKSELIALSVFSTSPAHSVFFIHFSCRKLFIPSRRCVDCFCSFTTNSNINTILFHLFIHKTPEHTLARCIDSSNKNRFHKNSKMKTQPNANTLTHTHIPKQKMYVNHQRQYIGIFLLFTLFVRVLLLRSFIL